MTTKSPRYIAPSISATAFNCPHCDALAKQQWYKLRADPSGKDGVPIRVTEETLNPDFLKGIKNAEEKAKIWLEKMFNDSPFLEKRNPEYNGTWEVHLVDISQCFNCDKIAVWVRSSLVHPVRGEAPPPNSDLSEDVRLDYDEASRIFQISPRGAAALLRLSIQKLCKELGGKGKNIDEDIAYLVKIGMDLRVQRSLDIVRVIGNEAVHPGQIDLRDDIAMAERLFSLVNIIADVMISQPKQIEDMYEKLPESKRAAIERRDSAPDN